jgi:hypothetical protein
MQKRISAQREVIFMSDLSFKSDIFFLSDGSGSTRAEN